MNTGKADKADTPSTELEPRERREALQRTSPSAKVVHEAIRVEGEEELRRPSSSIAWSGLAAGLAMGFSLMTEGILRSALPDAPWRELITALGYTMGFLIVTLGRKQLYTETTVTVALPMLDAPQRLPSVLRFWSIVFVTNIIGTILFAWAISIPGLFPPEFHRAFFEVGVEGADGDFWEVVLRGIIAGWLIALMVWLLPAAETARIFVIILVTYLIGIAKLAHVIAGSVEVAYAALAGGVSWAEYAFGFVLPALIGNTIGGVVLVAMLNHAQVRKEV